MAEFRHLSGLRLLVQGGRNYLLIPEGWTRWEGAVMIIPIQDSYRVEFTPGGR